MDRTSQPVWPADLLALVPVYNHAAQVGAVVAGLVGAGARVLVVDDGSTDGSGAAAAAAGAELVTHAQNRGKGAALRTGFARARELGYPRALTADADGQHPLAECLRLAAEPAAEHCILVGRRDMSAAPAASRFGRALSNFWVRVATGTDPGDSQTGLRVYPVEDALRLDARGLRYHYEIEVLVRGLWAGLSVRALPVQVDYPADRVTHFRAWSDNLRAAWLFTRLITRRCLPWPQRRLVARPDPTCWRQTLWQGLDPGAAALAAGMGAAMGVAPIPGLQTLAAAYFALRLRVNLPLALLASNVSFGPLLAVWAAIAVAIGRFLWSGEGPVATYHAVHEQVLAASGLGLWRLAGELFLDWALGSVLLMPLVGGVTALFAGVIVHGLARRRSGV